MADIDKKALIDEGCNLLNEAIAEMRKAQELFKKCGDVAPVVHGRWEIVVGSNGKEYMVCTGCRKQQDLTGVFSYCPNCGAKMDEKEG